MEEVLQRLLNVEKEAAARVKAAEAESARLDEEGRREAAALRVRLLAELEAEADARVAARTAEAEARRREVMAKAGQEIQDYARRLRERLPAAVRTVVDALGFPDVQADGK
ncbi:MAG: V-type ATP synthase subunit H [Lentisphaerae bacterium ADurb.BinA184]|nr:MAG: V-type ATP synthase subunit H [Lentisphaerae bacterium ADurb.BinA184]